MKKKSKIIVAFTIILAMVLAYFSPLANVIAETYGTGDYHVTVGVDKGDFETDVVKVNNHVWSSSSDEFRSSENTFTIELFVYKNGETYPDVMYCGGECGSHFTKRASVASNGNIIVFTITVTDYEDDFIDLAIVEGPPISAEEPGFDGKAYVVWTCGSGVCYHYFDDIPDFDDGNSTFYKDTTIKADNDQSITFDIHADRIGWVLKTDFERWVEAYKTKKLIDTINWTQVDPMDIIGEPNQNMGQWEEDAIAAGACTRPAEDAHSSEIKAFRVCVDEYAFSISRILPFVKLQPLNEPNYNNAHVSYGDRNFKVVIYNSEYKGVTMGDLTGLHYYPSSWTDKFVKRDQFDISGTSKINPTGIDSILLEDTVNIKALTEENNFVIASIVPLDVPEDAVTVTPNNDEFSIHFASNFYDNVVFEVTDNNGDKSYIQIKRYTVDAYFKYTREQKPVVAAEFYYDRAKNYDDFDLTLKILYKDGTTKIASLTAKEEFEDALGNPVENYVFDEQEAGGKGLKQSYFEYALTDGEINTIDKMYITAENHGGDSTTYAGAYVGSGPGVLVHVQGGE